jgi:osmoprotectant transport system permease protein
VRRAAAALLLVSTAAGAEVRVGSKAFTESVVLGEILAVTLRDGGVPARHRAQLGGTQILWKALLAGEIDVYVEYTGTITEELFAGRSDPPAELLASAGVVLGPALGFNNTYAIGMKEEVAARLGIARVSDLARHPTLRLGFSSEFMSRADGWPALRAAYGLPHADVRGLDHDLAYRALGGGAIDATDLYSTDAEIRALGLRVLADDRAHFPGYEAVLVHRADLPPEAARQLARLAGLIDEPAMIAMNARAKLDRVPEAEVAAAFVRARLSAAAAASAGVGRARRLLTTTADHLSLVGVSLLLAIAVALPLGILAARRPRAGELIVGAAGVVQTIPSLALLVLLIPLLGIGAAPAIAALFLYSLLPVVRNTHAGLTDLPRSTLEAAEAIGLGPRARLFLVELPMASRTILAGIKTAAVINVGTATLGALVGAGGYGQPILSGIRLGDAGLILEGALPAAALALAVQGAFELLERRAIPRGLRLR